MESKITKEYKKHLNSQVNKYLTLFERQILQKNLETDLDEKYRQRIEIMLLADEGKSQKEICQLLSCSQATARHWTIMAESGQAHYWKKSKIGRPQKINDQYLQRLQELVNHSPRDYGYFFERWTAQSLSRHLAKEFEIKVSDRYIHNLLKKMGLSTKLTTNHHQKSYFTKNLLIQDLPNNNQIKREEFLSFNLLKG